MDQQLKELIDLQREQNQLLKKNLWRLKFSLLGLFLLTTACALMLGFWSYKFRSGGFITPVFVPPPTTYVNPTFIPAPKPKTASTAELEGVFQAFPK